MKIIWFILITLYNVFSLQAQPKGSKISVIAFGSCSRESDKDQMWADINAVNPDLWIWTGDNIYGDTHDMNKLKQKYDHQKSHPDYQKLIRRVPVTGTWDDHDYGINDGGKYFSKKSESKALMLDFLDAERGSDVWNHEGVYSAHTYGSGKNKIKIINLDTRYFRDTLTREYFTDSMTNKRIYRNVINATGDILGDAQWTWLEKELKNSEAAINIINSSIQVFSEEHRFEKWANFPIARERLLQLIEISPARGIMIISGDRHIAEISELKSPKKSYPLIDFTSSGLTHTWSGGETEKNKFRTGDLIIQKNFGVLLIDWKGKTPKVTLQVRGKENQVFLERQIQF